jgi:RNA polymerase sigma-70 factor, ECF subfamily
VCLAARVENTRKVGSKMNALSITNKNRVPVSTIGTIGDKEKENSIVNTASTLHTALVAGAQLDRKAVLQAVYDAYAERLYKFIFFKVGNREDAEDVTSQVFIKAAHSLDVTQTQQSQLAWLYQVARTTITDHWRNYYRGVTTSLDEMEESAPLHLAAEPMLVGAAEDEDIDPAIEKVRSVLLLLPENYRRVLELRFLQGCSLRETAATMQITEANAKVIQHRAIQKALKVGAQLI